MAKSSGAASCDDRSAELLGTWIDRHLGLLRGLAELRDLGGQASSAVSAVLDVREIRRIRLSWELWTALAEGGGADVEALLVRHIPWSRLDLARRALYGH